MKTWINGEVQELPSPKNELQDFTNQPNNRNIIVKEEELESEGYSTIEKVYTFTEKQLRILLRDVYVSGDSCGFYGRDIIEEDLEKYIKMVRNGRYS